MAERPNLFRFRPRMLWVAFLGLSLGLTLLVAAATLTPDRASGLVASLCGGTALFFGFRAFRTPVWRLSVEVQPDQLVLWNGEEERLRLPWNEVEKVVLDPERSTCYVDGGSPERSLLVPGPGSHSSYIIRNKAELIEAILARVPESLVVDSRELCTTAPKA